MIYKEYTCTECGCRFFSNTASKKVYTCNKRECKNAHRKKFHTSYNYRHADWNGVYKNKSGNIKYVRKCLKCGCKVVSYNKFIRLCVSCREYATRNYEVSNLWI